MKKTLSGLPADKNALKLDQKWVPKPLRVDEYFYYAERSIIDLKRDIETLIYTDRNTANLKGKSISEYEFELAPYRPLLPTKRPLDEQGPVLLYCELSHRNQNETQVRFIVRPDVLSPALFFLMLIPVAAIILFFYPKGIEENYLILLKIALTILFPVLPLWTAYLEKKVIKNRFIKTFGLKPELADRE